MVQERAGDKHNATSSCPLLALKILRSDTEMSIYLPCGLIRRQSCVLPVPGSGHGAAPHCLVSPTCESLFKVQREAALVLSTGMEEGDALCCLRRALHLSF